MTNHFITLALVLLVAAAVDPNRVTAAEQGGQSVAPDDKEYAALVAADEAAQADIDKWRNESQGSSTNVFQDDLNRRIRQRLDGVAKAYDNFLKQHPDHVRARLSYGCFLNDRQDEAGAQVQWEKALQLDPRNADAYNNLAGRFAEIGPVRKAFDYFTRAIELKPAEASYYHNFADALYVLRRHAMTNYGIAEQQVFARALLLYSNAARLDPANATFTWDFAQTYYAIKPLPYESALKAWTNALTGARTELDREQILLQLARVKMLAGRFGEARAQLNSVTNIGTAHSKSNLLQAIADREQSTAVPGR